MPANNHEPAGRLTRDQQKQLLVLACTADRLEWRIQARRQIDAARRSIAVARLVRAGVDWLPRAVAAASGRNHPGWRRALGWIRAGLGLLS